MPHFKLRRWLPALTLALLAVSAATGFAQEEAAAEPEVHNVFETIVEGGPLVIAIWIAIIATSVTMVTFIVQGLLALRKDKLAPPPLVETLRQNMESGNYHEAWEICNANNNYLANVMKAALTRIGRGSDAVEEAIIEHGSRESTIM